MTGGKALWLMENAGAVYSGILTKAASGLQLTALEEEPIV
jgi:hypothetical protein